MEKGKSFSLISWRKNPPIRIPIREAGNGHVNKGNREAQQGRKTDKSSERKSGWEGRGEGNGARMGGVIISLKKTTTVFLRELRIPHKKGEKRLR